MDRFDDETLFAELRALRPTPRPEFAAELDERAAAGFPRRPPPSTTAWPFVALADLWRGMSPRRRLMPVVAFALAALVVTTAVIAISQSGTRSSSVDDAALGMAESGASSGAAAMGEKVFTPAPSHAGGAKHGQNHPQNGGVAPTNAGATVYEAEVPSVTSEPSHGGAVRPYEKGAPPLTHRDVERSSYVVLGTKPGEVAAAAKKVYAAVHAAGGYVLNSSVDSGTTGATGASFSLSIPSAKVNDALAAISAIAEVRERHDATNDITAPTVGAAEELRDSNAAIEGLLKELGAVETESERESVEARLREERRHHAAIRASLDHLDKRASMSEVTVRIVTDHGAGVTPPSKGDGSWGVGAALHDAGDILTIAAGVALIALAVLGPIALIVLAFWLANRIRVRRLRERTLG
ncbi:MAG TPA: DUF4349 domain-containing protein [Solirubrobacterales bacterium]|jgi:hypothetical protein